MIVLHSAGRAVTATKKNKTLVHATAYFCLNRYLGSGNSLTDIGESYCLGKSTVGYIVRKVCQAVWDVMRDEYIPSFTEER